MSEQIMRKWTEAFKNADWETVASLYAEDAAVSYTHLTLPTTPYV